MSTPEIDDSPGGEGRDWRAEARQRVDSKLKPLGSLGRLEDWAVQLAGLQRTLEPRVGRSRVLLFAADHGVAAEGVSAFPQETTAHLLRLHSAEAGIGIAVLARSLGVEVEAVDVGVVADVQHLPGIQHSKVRPGTRNLLHEPALTDDEVDGARQAGRQAVRRAMDQGVEAVGLGEAGIANTTSSSALLSALTGASPEVTVGRGSGVDDVGLQRKREVVHEALRRHADDLGDARSCLRVLGGLELAALGGVVMEAAEHRLPVVVDGFITSVAVLAAVREVPETREVLFFAHRSAEAGHGLVLEALEATPLFDLGLRLGEGTGAAVALRLLATAADLLRDMVDLEEGQRILEAAGA